MAALFIWYAAVREPLGTGHAMPTEITSAITYPTGTRNTPAFSLTDHTGATFEHTALTDSWAVVALGYRECDAPCPASLASMTSARDTLLDIDSATTTGHWLMVTLDPENDTSDTLSRYLAGFSDTLTGLTGDVDTLTRFVGALTGGDTPVPGQLWLLAPGGDVRARFDPPVDTAALTADLRLLRQP